MLHRTSAKTDKLDFSPAALKAARKEMVRIVVRGEVSVSGNRYFSPELVEMDGTCVHVGLDSSDASKVRVFQGDGSFLCEALAVQLQPVTTLPQKA
jgi:putative transposase